MPLKMKSEPLELPLKFTTLAGGYNHFINKWFEEPDTKEPQLFLAFLAGASYMKNLVHRASKLTPQEAQVHIKRIYDELNNLSPGAAQEALSAAAFGSTAELPSPGVNLIPPAPGPGEEPAPAPPPPQAPPAAAPQQPPAQQMQPMTWTIGMLREFEVSYQNAKGTGQPTFPFKEHTFRTTDAPAIINHLKDVFKNEK